MYSGLILDVVSSVVMIVADYRKIVTEGSNKRQLIVSFHNRSVAENSGIFLITHGTKLPGPFYFYITKGHHSNFRGKWQKEMVSEPMLRLKSLPKCYKVFFGFRKKD